MAKQLATADGVFYTPNVYAKANVASQPGGLATSGIICIVGEAAEGPDYSAEGALLKQNTFFGPTDSAQVIAKFGSGPLVDDYLLAAAPSNDDKIQGSPNGFYLLKTNVSVRAALTLARPGMSTSYGTLAAKNYGEPGNAIYASHSVAAAEVAPSVSATFLPVPSTVAAADLRVRVNGAAAQTVAIGAAATPVTVVASLNAANDILATGGVNRGAITGLTNTTTLAATVVDGAAGILDITIGGASSAWVAAPQVGDTLVIPNAALFGATEASAISGAGNANQGIYRVTATAAATIRVQKVFNLTSLTPTLPVVAVVATGIGSEATDIIAWSPITIKNQTGQTRTVLAAGNVGVNVTGTASGSQLSLALASGSWSATPLAGDQVKIPSTAPAAWLASGANTGWYEVVSATSNTMVLTRLSNGNPASFAATAIAATSNLAVVRPAIDGYGKGLEIWDGGGSATPLATIFKTSAGANVSWLSTSLAPVLNTSAQELQMRMDAAKSITGESLTAGGDVALTIGYLGTTATVTIGASTLTTAVVGGSGANLSVNLKNYATIGELAAFINSQTGYVASAGNNLFAQQPLMQSDNVTVLDQVSAVGICSQFGTVKPGRIKRDAWDYHTELLNGSIYVQIGNPTATKANSGLPDVQALAFLTGGARGATTNTNITNALAAAQKLRLNFVVPAFAQDASADITAGKTDAASTYTIAAIHAAVRTHCLQMSQIKRGRWRQGFLANQGSFQAARDAASTLASSRQALCFQSTKNQNSAGNIETFQSHGLAALAAGMQAAGFYRSITNKLINTSGVLVEDNSFDADDPDQVDVALQAGLLIAQAGENGGFKWVSDQTTYGTDDNFVFNSISAMYNTDLVTATCQTRMQTTVGDSQADVSAASVLGSMIAIFADLKALKLISPSDDAPPGFKNLKVRMIGNAIFISAEVKVTGSIDFIVISFLVSRVVQTATA